MMTNYNLIKIHSLDKSLHKRNDYPSIYPIQPIGFGTGQVECLTGLTLRLAQKHSMLTIPFYKHALKPVILSSHSHVNFTTSAYLYSVNGYGKYAQMVSSAITKSIGNFNTTYLTALPWKDIFDKSGHSLVKNHLVWCNHCWHKDIDHHNEPYVRLAWVLEPVHVCPHHLQPLNSVCPNCNQKQHVLSPIPRPWICYKCGHTLYKKTNCKTKNITFPGKYYWIASAIEKFIEKISNQSLELKPNSLSNALQGMVNSYSSGSYKVFSEQTQLHHRYLREWALNIRRPTFEMFIELCYRMTIPPDVLLMDQLPLTDPDSWPHRGTPGMVTMRKLTNNRKKKLRDALIDLIKLNPNPPTLPSEIAKNHSVTYNVIKYHFPEYYKIIRSRYTEWQSINREHKKEERLNRLAEGVNKLTLMDIYPSERKLKEFKLILPSELRIPYIKDKLEILQRESLSRLSYRIYHNGSYP